MLFILLFSACEPVTADQCVEQYTDGTMESDNGLSVDEVAADCEAAGGKNCDPDGWITREAAECIAVVSYLDKFAEDRDVHLDVHDGESEAGWHVHQHVGRDEMLLQAVQLDCVTGDLVAQVDEQASDTGSSGYS